MCSVAYSGQVSYLFQVILISTMWYKNSHTFPQISVNDISNQSLNLWELYRDALFCQRFPRAQNNAISLVNKYPESGRGRGSWDF